ncbi:MAG: J domain-containing protein [Pseudomonadota bacterium]
MAPQEVIRAAYKALSQKYHPDKNPGDAKAARIMAILNSAYGTLSDAQRRKEHDEWIAAEEWEIEWLESTQQEDSRGKGRAEAVVPAQAWTEESEPGVALAAPRRDWIWWCCGLAGCLVLGWGGAVLTQGKTQTGPDALVDAWDGRGAHGHRPGDRGELKTDAKAEAKTEAGSGARADPGLGVREAAMEAAFDSLAGAKPGSAEPSGLKPPMIRVAAVSQVVLARAVKPCDNESQTLVAPNGEPWPVQSGYVQGFPVGNKGDELQLTVDNGENGFAVFVKLYDLDRRSNVRYIFILAHDKLTVDKLAFGKYEVRYQRVDGGGADECGASKAGAAKPPEQLPSL